MGELLFDQLGLRQGTPVIQTPNTHVGPFDNVQPYLYWSCEGAPDSQGPCSSNVPATGFEFSFSFGNGFEGTDPGGIHIPVGIICMSLLIFLDELGKRALTRGEME
jgi:hypothetical protein